MAAVQNERDALMRSAPARVVLVTLPSNVVPQDLRGISTAAPAFVFKVDQDGANPAPSAITVTATLRGVPNTTSVAWSTSAGTATVTPQGAYGLAATVSALATDSVVVTAAITASGLTYQSSLTFVKVKDGSKGTSGQRGSLAVSRSITGAAWSDAEALAAVTGAGAAAPLATDTVTLYNVSERFAEQRRYSGTAWVPVDASVPGTTILPGTVTVEKLLVASSGFALNADPNCQDVTAWTGSGISAISDTAAPNGASALQCTANATPVLSLRFPIDPSKAYRTRMFVQQQSGSSTCYLLMAFYDGNGNLITGAANPAGWSLSGMYHYFGLAGEQPPASYTEYAVSFGLGESRGIPSNARFAAVGLLPNYSGPGGVQRVTGVVCHVKTTGDMLVEGTVTANLIDSRGLSVKDTAGNVILSAGSTVVPLSSTYVTPANSWVNNMLDASTWTPGASGTPAGFIPYGEGSTVTNSVVYAPAPDGGTRAVWEASGRSVQGPAGGASATLVVDGAKVYRFSCWMQAAGSTAGQAKLGVAWAPVKPLGGVSPVGDPNFASTYRGGMEPGRWYLFVGHVYGAAATNVPQSSISGVYDGVTGQLVAPGVDYQFLAGGSQTALLRAYQIGVSSAAALLRLWSPTVRICDGTEPTLDQLLAPALTQQVALKLNSTGGSLSGRVTMQVADGIFAGSNLDNGVYFGNSGIVAKNAGVTTISIDTSGNASYSGGGTWTGALKGATGEFSGVLTAGVLTASAFDSLFFPYAEAGSWTLTIPAKKAGWGTMSMRVTFIGGGGGGGGGYYSWQPNGDPAAGGGGGGQGTRQVFEEPNVTPGATISIQVGAGGAGGAQSTHWGGDSGSSSPGGAGTNGGATTYTYNGVTRAAAGGGGGSGGSADLAYNGGGYGDAPALNVPGGTVNGQPGGGQPGGSLVSSNGRIHAYGGNGGGTYYGSGGPAGASAPPAAYGAGGGGGSSFQPSGGAGVPGYVLVEFYDPNTVVLNQRYQNLLTWLDGRGLGTVPANAR